ncbi:MAG: hypothetical protein IKM33_01225, partial [Clostridia bacterium]|nr:hypothetical protein [Clostridia bacterium]
MNLYFSLSFCMNFDKNFQNAGGFRIVSRFTAFKFKLGFVGLRPKCKTQNAKCKIGERGRGSTQNAKSKYPSWLKEFLGCKLPQ